MAAGIVYLDVDDEITTAAARVRDMASRRVALVLPYGSRVATSRINFRLLSRDALINEKLLAVVAGDSATRALAASAGLPAFASVAEYESSLEGLTQEVSTRPTQQSPMLVAESTPAIRATPPIETAASAPGATPAPGSIPARPAVGDDTVRLQPPQRHQLQADMPAPGSQPQSWQSARRGSRIPLMVALAVLGLAVLVGGVAAYVVLPSATIVVTPRSEALAPIELTVTADPAATAPDPAARVVPAEVISLDVTATDTFPVTGMRIEETAATGKVRFSNLDFLRSNAIPAGSVVSTSAGVRFKTVATVTAPRADLVGLTVFPGRISVTVTAVEPGLAGNVEPNTIVIVPRGENPQALKVVNPDALSGGTHDAFPQVAQEDVDGALAQLTSSLNAAFQARLADPSIAAPGATVFNDTAMLDDPTPTRDPATLVGQEIASFDLGVTATGTVVTVDPAPVAAIAEALLRATVQPGHRLVAGSIDVKVGKPLVVGHVISFPASATAQQVAVLDPDELRALVLGKSLGDARQVLAPFGDVKLTVWPDWVGSVPTLANRVDLRVDERVPVEVSVPESSP